jgi:hypothetical protein
MKVKMVASFFSANVHVATITFGTHTITVQWYRIMCLTYVTEKLQERRPRTLLLLLNKYHSYFPAGDPLQTQFTVWTWQY